MLKEATIRVWTDWKLYVHLAVVVTVLLGGWWLTDAYFVGFFAGFLVALFGEWLTDRYGKIGEKR